MINLIKSILGYVVIVLAVSLYAIFVAPFVWIVHKIVLRGCQDKATTSQEWFDSFK